MFQNKNYSYIVCIQCRTYIFFLVSITCHVSLSQQTHNKNVRYWRGKCDFYCDTSCFKILILHKVKLIINTNLIMLSSLEFVLETYIKRVRGKIKVTHVTVFIKIKWEQNVERVFSVILVFLILFYFFNDFSLMLPEFMYLHTHLIYDSSIIVSRAFYSYHMFYWIIKSANIFLQSLFLLILLFVTKIFWTWSSNVHSLLYIPFLYLIFF